MHECLPACLPCLLVCVPCVCSTHVGLKRDTVADSCELLHGSWHLNTGPLVVRPAGMLTRRAGCVSSPSWQVFIILE